VIGADDLEQAVALEAGPQGRFAVYDEQCDTLASEILAEVPEHAGCRAIGVGDGVGEEAGHEFGDIAPRTALGRLLGAASMILGYAIISVVSGRCV